MKAIIVGGRSSKTCLLAVFLCAALHSGQGDSSRWRTFSSHSGWTINYPKSWVIGSCRACPDPTIPGVFVALSDPQERNSVVLIEQLAEKPPAISVEQWLRHVEGTANLSQRIEDQWTLLGGQRALRVTTRSLNGTTSETVYVVRGSQTFSVLASDIDNAVFDVTYRKMRSTFTFSAGSDPSSTPRNSKHNTRSN